MGQCLSEGFRRPPGAGEGVATDGHLLGTRNSLAEGRQVDERFGARETSLEQDTMCRCTGHETIRRSTDLHYNLWTRVQPDPNDGGQMAIAEQFRIDPGTEMIPTPPIQLPAFDLDQSRPAPAHFDRTGYVSTPVMRATYHSASVGACWLTVTSRPFSSCMF